MDFIDQNIFPLFLLMIGALLFMDAITNFQQKGVSKISTGNRFQGILITGLITLGLLVYTTSNKYWDINSLFLALSPILVPFIIMIMQRKKDEIHIKKYEPQKVMDILEKKLNDKRYSFNKDVKANEDYISSNYITKYYLDDSNQTIKIKWKDLETSGLEVEFQNFADKDFINEVVGDLREERPPISFFKFNKISLIISAIAIYIGSMQLLGF
ncbi:hypothetical protein FZC76_09425 [Sutcliffiella horikoshii]|uniref:Uncharacterized protein n=1 Tax=Sutcliffiella horikoshii TaxID=79883 RepID=A0A5D4T183_9BACI|nr:hypothetical protein [Sutcliffiella horikoshii]TYS69135.1 hypothetical protein FZC76_09425 [Sutcliffiella horikoshii]